MGARRTHGRWMRIVVAASALALGSFAIRCGESSTSGFEGPCELPCNDGNPCTRDECDSETGMCEFIANVDGRMCVTPAVADGICKQGSCEVFMGVFTCNEQGVRSAIDRGGGPYTFDCDGSRSIVTSGELVVDRDVRLNGEGKVTLDGDGKHRVLRVTDGVSATLAGFTITGGRAGRELTSEPGGGIANLGGTLTLTGVTVHGNTADWGGGLYMLPDSTTIVTNCTIANNVAQWTGGGIHNDAAQTTIRSTTISNNYAMEGGSALQALAPVTIANSLIDGSCGGGASLPRTVSLGHNVESPGDTCQLTMVDQSGVSEEDLQLGELGEHGGGMPTCDLGPQSIAIDQVPENECVDDEGSPLKTDQRGVWRPFGDGCDIGAIEWMGCEDHNECTDPVIEAGVCEHRAVDDDRPCGGGAGVCRGGSCLTREPPVTISGPSPFSGCACDPEEWHYQCSFSDTEFQPFVSVNPTNPDNIAVVWTQDFNPQRGLVAAVSLDGGRDWQSVVIPSVSECSGSEEFRTVWHPWLAFTPDGQLFLAYDSFGRLSEDVVYHAHVITSRDGGLSWGPPIRVAPAYATAPSIASDRHQACTLHLAWNEAVNDVPAVLSASTFDCGATWSEPSLIHVDPGTSRLRVQVLALPDGTPVAFFKQRLPGGLYVKRSVDGGASWPEQPIRISDAAMGPTHAVTPGEATVILAASDRPMAAVDDESGRLAVVWQQGIEQAPPMQVYFSLSEDGGSTWSTPERIDQTAPNPNRSFVIEQAFRPSVAFASDGTIGVMYYNFQNDTPNDDRADADVWFIHCHPARDDCTSHRGWSPPVRLTSRSFDYHRAFYCEVATAHGEGYWLGDYMGLTTSSTDFLAAFTVTTETDAGDIMFVRIAVR